LLGHYSYQVGDQDEEEHEAEVQLDVSGHNPHHMRHAQGFPEEETRLRLKAETLAVLEDLNIPVRHELDLYL
jgi:hypothetical protein